MCSHMLHMTKPGSYARAVNTFNCWAIVPTPGISNFSACCVHRILEMVQWPRAPTVLQRNHVLIPITHIRQLTMAYVSSSRWIHVFWPFWYMHTCTNSCRCTHILIYKNNLFLKCVLGTKRSFNLWGFGYIHTHKQEKAKEVGWGYAHWQGTCLAFLTCHITLKSVSMQMPLYYLDIKLCCVSSSGFNCPKCCCQLIGLHQTCKTVSTGKKIEAGYGSWHL